MASESLKLTVIVNLKPVFPSHGTSRFWGGMIPANFYESLWGRYLMLKSYLLRSTLSPVSLKLASVWPFLRVNQWTF